MAAPTQFTTGYLVLEPMVYVTILHGQWKTKPALFATRVAESLKAECEERGLRMEMEPA